jgi:hypothetical protein
MRAGEDTVVNRALWRRGYRAYRAQGVRLVHRSPCAGPAKLVGHHFQRGTALGRLMAGDGRERGRQVAGTSLHRFLTGYAKRRLTDTDLRVAIWGSELTSRYAAVRPLVKLGVAAAWAGTFFGLLRATPMGRSSSRAR